MNPMARVSPIQSAVTFLIKLPVPVLILVALFASYLLDLLVAIPLSLAFPQLEMGGPKFAFNGIRFVAVLIAACVVAPLGETLVFQWACIKLLHGKLKWSAASAIAASALLFGLAHLTYSVLYMVMATIGGLVLGAVFVLEQEKRGSPFWVVAAIHALRNLIATFAFSIAV